MRVLGVDPGLDTTGYACVLASSGGVVRLVEGGVVRSTATQPLERRLHELFTGLCEVCTDLQPDVLAVEELYVHYKHPRTAILMGHARGVLYLAAAEHDIPVVSYAATRIKKAVTGSGRASKAQMQAMIQTTFGLPAIPEPADVADAAAAALCHINAEAHQPQTVEAAS